MNPTFFPAFSGAGPISKPTRQPDQISLLAKSQDVLDLRFAGQAKELPDFYEAMRGAEPLSDEAFDELLAYQEDVLQSPYLGRVPETLSSVFKSPEEAYPILDFIAEQLSRHWEGDRRVEGKPPEKVAELAKQHFPDLEGDIQISYIDSGADGDVYKLEFGQQAFALKRYRKGGSLTLFEPLTFLEAQGAKDSMKTYMCGFAFNNHWLFSEFIPSDRPFTPEELDARGPSDMATIARQHNLVLAGTYDRVNSILVDPHFIRKLDPNSQWDTQEDVEKGIRSCQHHLRQAYERGAEYQRGLNQ